MAKQPITEEMKQEAKRLAAREYHIQLIDHCVIDDEVLITGRLVEMPHCIAQAGNATELSKEMEEVAYEYILAGLQYGVKIPDPYPLTQGTSA